MSSSNIISRIRVVLATAVFSLAAPIFAEGTVWYPYESNLGADGYDVVAYFTKKRPVKGNQKYTAEYEGQIWQFASQENHSVFIADPARYIPQYGGFCAYAMSQGYSAYGDPAAWTVHEGRLFFNYNLPTRILWVKNKDSFIVRADKAWPGFVKGNSDN